MSAVELVDITKSFGGATVVDRLNLTLEDGSLTVLVGPSGCGKSTTLRIVAGLESADGGSVQTMVLPLIEELHSERSIFFLIASSISASFDASVASRTTR